MIISKTPFRISLFGGGSDYPEYFTKNGGKTIGFSINRYNYILFRSHFQKNNFKYNIHYSLNEKANFLNSIKHASVRETLKYFKYNDPFEIHYNGELPARTGLGSSSAFTVGLVNIMQSIQNKKINKFKIAKIAMDIERNKIKETVGCQDQILTAVGGINKINFGKNINLKKIKIDKKNQSYLENHSMLIFSGIVRSAEQIEKKKFPKKNYGTLKKMKAFVEPAYKLLASKKIDVPLLGEMLNDAWKLKKSLHKSVTNNSINDMYERALKLGAYGGKVLGAGGGGFLYVLAKPEVLKRIKKKFQSNYCIDFKISDEGTQILSRTNDY